MNTNITKSIVKRNIGRLETDDLISIATLAALEAEKTYKPDMGTAPDTWQWIQVSGRVKSAICAQISWNIQKVEKIHGKLKSTGAGANEESVAFISSFLNPAMENQIEELPGEDTHFSGFEFVTSLPADCRKIADIVLRQPETYTGMLPKQARGAIVHALRDEGWSWSRVWAAMTQMKKEVTPWN